MICNLTNNWQLSVDPMMEHAVESMVKFVVQSFMVQPIVV